MTEASTTKLRLKYGDIEFEMEGNPETVAKEREAFQKLLFPAMEVMSRQINFKNSIPRKVEIIEENLPNKATHMLGYNCNSESKTYSSFNQLIKEKNFSKDVDRVVAAAYFLCVCQNKTEFSKNDILEQFRNAKLKTPSNVTAFLASNVEKANIQVVRTDKGLQIYSILDGGISYCEEFEAKEDVNKIKKTTKTAKSKSNKEYPSLSYTVDDLHLDKYCELSKLSGYTEQIWVLMYIYFTEKEHKTFTRDEVTQLLRKRFGINPTDRQIKHFFETAGRKLHKEGSKKDMRYTLMQGGIDEAKRIIAENQSRIQN